MSPLVALLGALALLGAATAAGLLLRRRGARVRSLRGVRPLSPDVLGASRFGRAGTVVQFSTEYCARCPGVRRVLGELTAAREGLEFVHVDLTHDAALAKRFGVLQTPTVLLIDREGRPSSRLSGTVSREALRDAIDALTGDRA